VNEAIGVAASGDWLVREITSEYQQIRDSVVADPLKPYTNEEFDAAFAELLNFARTRPSFIAQQVRQIQ
jgi:hypothetical protein